MKIEIRDSFTEYKFFVGKYVLPLLGVSKEKNFEECDPTKTQDALVYYESGFLYFANRYNNMFRIYFPKGVIEENVRLVRCIVVTFFVISKFKMDEKSAKKINNHYASECQLDVVYKMAVQKGICTWIV